MIQFVFMLTHHDRTVPGAADVYKILRDTDLGYIGVKDIGVTSEQLTEITALAHADGREVMLEVVSTGRQDERRSLRAAARAGVDWVLGGTHPDDGVDILAGTRIRYCPFPGRVIGHPSVLEGGIFEIAEHARELTARDGVHGLDLLAYRHQTADAEALTRAVAAASTGPVIAAGSVASAAQIRALARAHAWGFTIGGAIFEGRFSSAPDIAAQVREILDITASAETTEP
jgi:hypothetical protein